MKHSSPFTSQTYISPIEVLTQAMELSASVWDKSSSLNTDDVQVEIASIWLPIFRTEANLVLALQALIHIFENDVVAEICQSYLDIFMGVKNESQ